MKEFDLKSVNNDVDQLWSAMEYTSNTVIGQVNSDISGINFNSSNFLSDLQIVSDSKKSIKLGHAVGSVAMPKSKNFTISMVVLPREDADMWVVKFDTGIIADSYKDKYSDIYNTSEKSESAGIKVNSDSTISLFWVSDGISVEQKTVLSGEMSYLSLVKNDNDATMQVNDVKVTVSADDIDIEGFQLGNDGAESEILIDKVAISVGGNIPDLKQYFKLFRSQRIDNVARPEGNNFFVYISENNTSKLKEIDRSRFSWEDGYAHAGVTNNNEDALFSIEKRAGFLVQYSLDNGINWIELPNKKYFEQPYPNILLRHDVDSDNDYWINLRTTVLNRIPMNHFDVTFDGPVHMPDHIGYGLYDVTFATLNSASLTVSSEDHDIKTIEILAHVTGFDNSFVKADSDIDYTYVNGESSGLPTDGIYHIVIVFKESVNSVTINPDKEQFKLAGLGAGESAYKESDAFYIYNTFAGNTFASCLDEIGHISDGASPNSDEGLAASAMNLEWSN